MLSLRPMLLRIKPSRLQLHRKIYSVLSIPRSLMKRNDWRFIVRWRTSCVHCPCRRYVAILRSCAKIVVSIWVWSRNWCSKNSIGWVCRTNPHRASQWRILGVILMSMIDIFSPQFCTSFRGAFFMLFQHLSSFHSAFISIYQFLSALIRKCLKIW